MATTVPVDAKNALKRILYNSFGFYGYATKPEKYKQNFDIPSEGPSLRS